MELHWSKSFTTSCLHIAHTIVHDPSVGDSALVRALRSPAIALGDEISRTGKPTRDFWNAMLAWAHRCQDNVQLVGKAYHQTAGEETIAWDGTELARCIDQLESAATDAFPKMADELEHRSGPIRQQWEARGPGFLRAVARFSEDRLVVGEADIVLVYPCLGGAGSVGLASNSVRIEAVLTNPNDRLPEVVRLGWLLSQLCDDSPEFSDAVPEPRSMIVSALAMVPVALEAAETVELASADAVALQEAVSMWRVAENWPNDPFPALRAWWGRYREKRPRWSVALHELNQMLGD